MKRIITIMVFLVAGLVVTTGFDMNSAQGPGGEGVSGDAGTNAGIGPGCECGDIVIQTCSHICKDCCCSGYVSWDMSPGIATNEVELTIVNPSIATIHKDSCDGQDATWKFWPCKSGTYTFYVKGVNPGYTKIHAVLKKNGVICREAWFDLTVMSLSLHEVILPYNFIAIPDKRVADRMGSEVTQDTMTQVKFVYCVLPAGESFDSVDAFLTYDKDGRTLPPLPLNPTYGCDAVSQEAQISLDNSFMSSQLQHFDVKLRGRKADCAEC